MTQELPISWRTVYWKLAGLSVLVSAAFLFLALSLLQTRSCNSWHLFGCFMPGAPLDKPFGDAALAYGVNADFVLWAAMLVLALVGVWRRVIGRGPERNV